MEFFDFHHHDFNKKNGIYNLKLNEIPPANYFSAGIHPQDISPNFEEDFLWLKTISKSENCVAIGECGLDGLIDIDENLQNEIFQKQIELANELQKPIIIHCVRRFPHLLHFKKKAKVPMIVHGFNKRKTVGEDLLKHQFCLSFGKSALYNVNLQDFLKEIPIDKLFLESDSADFEIKDLYYKIAELKGYKIEYIQEKTKENLKNLQIYI
ncbi:hydrolase TatD [Kaistella haifensis DSM 19056]|uniref:Hydrolase TatD n=1 Tax=Kaistella haifensis DSM 19056 TaxID=1450526 RepID=A0A246BBX3_9FLAO|nr:TatD family hydrolase [Kaistella haifensis]OWK99165.1 hydrolase TatD [Kaistella haifensis DSM 19056]